MALVPQGGVKNEISNYHLPRLRGEEKVTHKQSAVGTTKNNKNHGSGAPEGVKNEISNYQLPRLRGEEKVTHKQSVVGTKTATAPTAAET